MPPPPLIIDAAAVSGITGSISLACWIIVFMPQIYENYSRKSSEGLSLTFITLWLIGDIFNILGAVMQHLLPTMIILAVYYTAADVVLLWQCLAYRHNDQPIDASHLSPAKPLHDDVLIGSREDTELVGLGESSTRVSATRRNLLNVIAVVLVMSAGFFGWYLTIPSAGTAPLPPPPLTFDPLAQFFGWLCAAFYLGSRVPQIVLNYQRKSCEGISFMFFLFACLGNVTYTISILCIGTDYDYLVINASWLAGSMGTLILDLLIFVQFFLYSPEDAYVADAAEESASEARSEGYGSV